MEIEKFSELYERIQLDGSILLLGQNYSQMAGGKDQVWLKLVETVYPELDLPKRHADYPELWRQAVQKDEDAAFVMEHIEEVGRLCADCEAVSSLMKLRWSLVYTSALDLVSLLSAQNGGSFVPTNERNARPQYFNKGRNYIVPLCGCQETPIPALNSKIQEKNFDRQIRNKISWISNTYLETHGVLVIDGLIPEYDWLTDNNLFDPLMDMPRKSIYWFSAPEQLEENASLLVEQGILTVCQESFYEQMVQHMPEILEAQEIQTEDSADDVLYTSLTLRLGDRRMHTVRIRRADIVGITGDKLCLIDDDILQGDHTSNKNRAQKFADFLMQGDLPSWYLFHSEPNEVPFYITRTLDQDLEKKVYEALKENGTARKPVILSGPSNSGKSMMLANLALKIASRRKYPVIYIRGEMLPGSEKRLDDFINNWFCDASRYNSERPDKIIVIWDGSGLKCSEQDYASMQKQLFNRNVQVVGSVYSSITSEAVQLSQDLSGDEQKALDVILHSLGDPCYAERFKEIRGRYKSESVLKNSSLLYLLQSLFKYDFDGEFKSLATILANQFRDEKDFAERETGERLHEYVEDFFKAQRIRAKTGVASSFQEKLQLLLDRMAVNSHENQVPAVSDEKLEKLEKLKTLSRKITKINQVLAVSSEFGVKMPLNLLLKYLRDEDGNSYLEYGEDVLKIINILRTDTLLNFECRAHPRFGEEHYVSFRNPIEAENYICLLCDLPIEDCSDTRKKKEVEILKQIIDTARTEAEVWSVVELVRQFGPNGHGKLSEQEKMRNCKDYVEYREYWLELAETLIQQFPDDPEVTLLYAHLTREYIFREETDRKIYYADIYKEAQIRLETALQRMEKGRQDNSMQYDRLSIELCANYQQSLCSKFDVVTYQSIKNRILKVFRKQNDPIYADLHRDFSSNYILDILLNAYEEFNKAVSFEDPNRDNELADMVSSIDHMLNLDDLMYERDTGDLLQKIRKVYMQLGDNMSKLTEWEKKITSINGDAILYLKACMIWQEKAGFTDEQLHNSQYGIFYANRYTVICHDVPYVKADNNKELLNQVEVDAARVVDFLQKNEGLIRKSRSERCLAMLIRAKWYLKAHTPMLAEKQCVNLTRNDWEEFNNLCNYYHSIHDVKVEEPFIPAYFLSGVYEWIYGNGSHAVEWFNQAKINAHNDFQMKTVERLILCSEGTDVPRTFLFKTEKRMNRKYVASIVSETTPSGTAVDQVCSRYGMGASEQVVKYLYDGSMPREDIQQAPMEGVIRFNLIGAQVGIPQNGGMHHD